MKIVQLTTKWRRHLLLLILFMLRYIRFYIKVRFCLQYSYVHVEETRWTCSQEGTGVEPTGEAKDREEDHVRSQHTWRRTRIAELERKHLTWNEAKRTAENRIRWRRLQNKPLQNVSAGLAKMSLLLVSEFSRLSDFRQSSTRT